MAALCCTREPLRTLKKKKGKAYEQKSTILTVKHGGRPVLLWGFFAVLGSGHHEFFEVSGYFGKDWYDCPAEKNNDHQSSVRGLFSLQI